jgi:ubiquinone/menaquinone biosynthesis C-methylase UbiE
MSFRNRTVHLLPREALVRTGPVDHADWNYRPVLGRVQRLRFGLVKSLLGSTRYPRLLEIGYGSGVFMPELRQHCQELFGLDPHASNREVEAVLARHGIAAELHSGSAEQLPFPTGSLDCAVSVSAIEYVPDIERACAELTRVLRPGGHLIVVTPGRSPLWDLALKVTTGESASQYADRRERLLPALRRHFRPLAEKSVPAFGGSLLRLYTGIKLERA